MLLAACHVISLLVESTFAKAIFIKTSSLAFVSCTPYCCHLLLTDKSKHEQNKSQALVLRETLVKPYPGFIRSSFLRLLAKGDVRLDEAPWRD